MKALKEMNNVQKAYVLAKLFPEQVKVLIIYAQHQIETFKTNEKQIRKSWTDDTIKAGMWYAFIKKADKTLKTHHNLLHRSPRLYSDQLFYSQSAQFMIFCLIEFADTWECDPYLRLGINMFFGYTKPINLQICIS